VIPVEIGITNYMSDTLNIKINEIKAYFKGNKNIIFEGIMNTSIDTVITDLQMKIRIPVMIKLDKLNRNSFNMLTDLNNYRLEILFPRTIVNDSIIYDKNMFFVGKVH
ncbi:hypothetical protein LJC00_00850, partial [Dysgonomonas sp. OttesenSCG-928-M03]|nr:hypothetical protein [Dysgonomonas sp. OttesenSCG-928-M03]